jgi:biotin carboxyl carrier protein
VRYFAKIGKRELELDLTVDAANSGALSVALGAKRCVVDCAAVAAGEKYSILIDGRSFDVTVDGDGRRLSLIVDGHAWQAEVEDERERAMSQIAGHGGSVSGIVESVMPGIVRKIDVVVGSAVKPGDRLLVLEAMKMENEIRAEHDGVIDKVLVSEGQTVDGGQPLVSIVAAS